MKTVEEWSNAFDVLLGEYIRNTPIAGLTLLSFDEYEKSLFLTKAQEEVVKALYSDTIDPFETTEERRRQLDSLITLKEFNVADSIGNSIKDSLNHYRYILPDDCWYIIYEQVTLSSEDRCLDKKSLDVIPITHDAYNKAVKNPFKSPNTRKAWRMDISKLEVDIISKFIIDTYLIRYIKKPSPIILVDLPEDLTIEGDNKVQTCILSELIHSLILETAIKLAIASRSTQNNTKN